MIDTQVIILPAWLLDKVLLSLAHTVRHGEELAANRVDYLICCRAYLVSRMGALDEMVGKILAFENLRWAIFLNVGSILPIKSLFSTNLGPRSPFLVLLL